MDQENASIFDAIRRKNCVTQIISKNASIFDAIRRKNCVTQIISKNASKNDAKSPFCDAAKNHKVRSLVV